MKRRRIKRKKLISENTRDDYDCFSELPDSALFCILSFLDTKYVVQTCVLSKKFKNLWSFLPDLNFDSSYFNSMSSFEKFVDQTLTHRDNSTWVDGFKFTCEGTISSDFLDKVMNYAISHGVRRLNVDAGFNISALSAESWYHSESLRAFTLKRCVYSGNLRKPVSFPELKTLHLETVSFPLSDIVLSCPCLTELTLIGCLMCIFNIDAPQLTKFVINSGLVADEVVVSATRLASFSFRGIHILQRSVGEFSDVEYVRIDVQQHQLLKCQTLKPEPEKEVALNLISLLKLFHSAKYVTLSLETILVLSKCPDLLAHESPPFGNMKSLKIVDIKYCHNSVIPVPVMTYLLNNSPHAEFTMEVPWCFKAPFKRCRCGQFPE